MLGRILCLLLLGLAAAPAQTAVVKVGGRSVRIPRPEGFLRYDGKSTKIDGMQASFAPASNHILAAFGEPADLQSAVADEFPRLSRSFNVQANWQYEDAVLTTEEFAAVKTALSEQLGSLKSTAPARPERVEVARTEPAEIHAALTEVEKSASSAVSAKLNSALRVKVGEVAPLGVFAETPESICFLMVVKSRLAGAPLEDPIDPNTAVAGCVALVRDRLLYLYANASYDGKPDADWAREQIVLWRDAVLAANAPGAPDGEDLPPEPMADDDGPWWRRK
ncbi:MAG TPA: hypothetical protein VGO11_28000, partial [Chthoniobacteraceae bacterium]|nr:hypothetical protein [Chthoniobacteraceae bacterium]